MIAGDRKALKATLTHGISDILQEVVDLYSINLNQLGVQTTVLAGLAYTAVMAPNWYQVGEWETKSIICSAFYSTLIQLAMIFSVLAMVVSTLASSFGPSLTLTGKNSKMIIYAVRSMQQVQEYAFWLSAISIGLILCAIPFYAFSEYLFPHAVIIVICSFFGSIYILRKGMVTLQSNRFSGINCLNAILRAFEGGEEEEGKKATPPPPMVYEDYLWKRKPPHKGDGYTYLYCALKNGKLYFFRDKEAYDTGDEPVMDIKLRYLHLTVEHKLFYRPTGQISLTLFGDTFVENKMLQFALLPLEDHEILTYDTSFEFQAIDEHSFEQWKDILTQVEEYYKQVNGNPLAAILENLK